MSTLAAARIASVSGRQEQRQLALERLREDRVVRALAEVDELFDLAARARALDLFDRPLPLLLAALSRVIMHLLSNSVVDATTITPRQHALKA